MVEGGSRVPENVREVAAKLEYRDFIAVGLLVDKLKVREPGGKPGQLVSDNWIYIQEPDVLVGRLQVFNNWSPFLVADRSKVWLGAEYFCYEGDELWTRSDESMAKLAADELAKIDIIERQDVRDAVVVRMAKTYPAYFGAYDRFQEVRDYVDAIPNLYLVGRNGMHKYNNQDHSMLTAMTAVDNIIAGRLRQAKHLGSEHRAGLPREQGKRAIPPGEIAQDLPVPRQRRDLPGRRVELVYT